MKLAELQRYFSEAATTGSGPRPGLEEVFAGGAGLSARERLGIYNRAYYSRLLEALGAVFEHTRRVLGEAEFRRLGLSYLARRPSEHPAVERVGRALPAFLRALPELDSAIADLADLEWARLCALVSPNPTALAWAEGLAPADFARARVRFVPSLRWLTLDARALQAFAGGPLGKPSGREMCSIAVWRPEHAVQQQRIDEAELAALEMAAKGGSVSEVCACFVGSTDTEAVAQAFRVLAGWFAKSWLESLGATAI